MILVTGGSGFIGAALVRALVKAGERVRVLDNNFRAGPRRLDEVWGSIEFVEGDTRNAATVQDATKGVDEVCHLAFINGTRHFYENPGLVLDVGVRGMVNVLDGCRRHSVKQFLLVSSSEVYQTPPTVPTDEAVPLSIPDPHNPRYSYGAGKIISEMMALHAASYLEKVVIARPHNIYGPDMGNEHVIPQLAARIKETGVLEFHGEEPVSVSAGRVFWGGSQTRAFCYIDDAVDALMLLRAKGTHLNIYNVGNPEEVAIADLAQRIATYAGGTLKVVGVAKADGGTQRRCPNIAKLAALGFGPKVSLDQGLPATLDWYLGRK